MLANWAAIESLAFRVFLLQPNMYSWLLTHIENAASGYGSLSFGKFGNISIQTGKQTISVSRMTSTWFSAFYKPINENNFFNFETDKILNVLWFVLCLKSKLAAKKLQVLNPRPTHLTSLGIRDGEEIVQTFQASAARSLAVKYIEMRIGIKMFPWSHIVKNSWLFCQKQTFKILLCIINACHEVWRTTGSVNKSVFHRDDY